MTQTTTREIKQTSAHCRVMTDVPPDDPVSWMIEQLGGAEATCWRRRGMGSRGGACRMEH